MEQGLCNGTCSPVSSSYEQSGTWLLIPYSDMPGVWHNEGHKWRGPLTLSGNLLDESFVLLSAVQTKRKEKSLCEGWKRSLRDAELLSHRHTPDHFLSDVGVTGRKVFRSKCGCCVISLEAPLSNANVRNDVTKGKESLISSDEATEHYQPNLKRLKGDNTPVSKQI